jgi:putative cardiolipin synthase
MRLVLRLEILFKNQSDMFPPATRLARLVVAVLILSGCTVDPADYPRTPSKVLVAESSGVLGRLFAPPENSPGEWSAFTLLSDPQPAFEARAALVVKAERSVDLQYYIWEGDRSGSLLAWRLAEAADRGVRVRILIDDFTTEGHDLGLAAVNSHPNVEVRLFNPYGRRGARGLQMLGDFSRLNHRMHNKALIADGRVAIVGGRNIGDHYFGLHGTANFRDLDVLAAGPVVADVAASFDSFWNSEFAVPVEALKFSNPETLAKQLAEARQSKAGWLAANAPALQALVPAKNDPVARLREWRAASVWGPARVIVDDPAKVGGGAGPQVAAQLAERANLVKHELMIETAYFIPGERTIAAFGEMTARGVKVRVLTNSLASTDVAAVHAVYAPRRRPLLDRGVELHEFRVDSRSGALLGSSGASLHSKVVVFDRESVFIGSFNLDARSAIQNTELGILIDVPELAKRVAAVVEDALAPDTSWQVVPSGKKDVVWRGRNGEESIEIDHEPGASIWRRMSAVLLGWLPEKQL